MEKKTTLEEVLKAINIFDKDVDIYVEEVGGDIGICPPIKLSPCAKEKFKNVLNAKMDGFTCIEEDEELSQQVYDFLVALAGYCSVDTYDNWFEKDAEEL